MQAASAHEPTKPGLLDARQESGTFVPLAPAQVKLLVALFEASWVVKL